MSARRKVKTVRATWLREPWRPESAEVVGSVTEGGTDVDHVVLKGKPRKGRREIRLNDVRVPLIATLRIWCTCPPRARALDCPTERHRVLAVREAAKRNADKRTERAA